jgi:hypothetical protein
MSENWDYNPARITVQWINQHRDRAGRARQFTIMSLFQDVYNDLLVREELDEDVVGQMDIVNVVVGSLFFDIVAIATSLAELRDRREAIAIFFGNLHESYEAVVGIRKMTVPYVKAKLFMTIAGMVHWMPGGEITITCTESNESILIDHEIADLLVGAKLSPEKIRALADRLNVAAKTLEAGCGARSECFVSVIDNTAYLGVTPGELLLVRYAPNAHRIKKSGWYEVTFMGGLRGPVVSRHRKVDKNYLNVARPPF